MLRSFSYAAYAALERHTSRRAADFGTLEPWAERWERAASLAFLKSYRETAGDSPILPRGEGAFAALLGAYMVDKSLYELLYELNNRPAWVRIPMLGLLALSESRGDEPHRG
jgi:maltose alpha-D-glucosyltransferase/alpha-amylase